MTEYFLVSKRAVEMLGEVTAGAVYPGLYNFAERLENPSFFGWIVEADFFPQVNDAGKTSSELKLRFLTERCAPLRPITTQGFEHTKNKNRMLTIDSKAKSKTKKKATQRIVDIASKLAINNSPGPSAVCCKPTAWNQGGYDAFFVEFVKDKIIHLRFCQITKGQSHTLKGEYLYTVVCFFEKAGYTVEAVEIALILTNHNSISFSLEGITGVEFLEKYSVFNSSEKWVATDTRIAEDVARYELTLSRKTLL